MAQTTDRAATTDRATATFAPEQIGRTRYRTLEGFLCCEGVRIARTGAMMYTAAEMPDIEPGGFTSMITIERGADVLFDPDSILSYAGKPVTNDHPPEPVTPANAKKYAVGAVLNPRRGEGVEFNYLIGDLLITDEQAIAAVEAGKVELSAGYDVEVEQIAPGVGRQTKNVGNHVALVERGRAGPSCAIQDAEKEPEMAKRTTRILDGIRKAFKAKDEAALEANLEKAEDLMDDEEGGDEPQTVVIKIESAAAPAEEVLDEGGEADPYEARFKALEDCVSSIKDAIEGLKPVAADKLGEAETEEGEAADEEAKEEEKEADKPQAQDAMSKAEILAPGIKLPVQDAAAPLKRSALTDLRRRALKAAVTDSARKVHVDAVLSGRGADFDKMAPSQVAMVFDAAAAVTRAANNGGQVRRFDVPQGPMTAARMQERNEERRKARAN